MIARSASPRESAKTPAEQRESRKNLIGILNDKAEEQRAIESLVKSDRHMKDFLLGLMAAVLSRRRDAR
jgi:hypothetical protein